jgi:hypothetical protein
MNQSASAPLKVRSLQSDGFMFNVKKRHSASDHIPAEPGKISQEAADSHG